MACVIFMLRFSCGKQLGWEYHFQLSCHKPIFSNNQVIYIEMLCFLLLRMGSSWEICCSHVEESYCAYPLLGPLNTSIRKPSGNPWNNSALLLLFWKGSFFSHHFLSSRPQLVGSLCFFKVCIIYQAGVISTVAFAVLGYPALCRVQGPSCQEWDTALP